MLVIVNLRLCVTVHICKYSCNGSRCRRWKSLFSSISWLSAEDAFESRCITLKRSFVSKRHRCCIILMASPARVQDWVKNKHGEGKSALLMPRIRTIGELFHVHNDDINTCVRNQHDYTLGLSSGWRKRLRVRMCERKKNPTIWLSCICGSYIFSNAIGLLVSHFKCLWTRGLITARYKTSWHWGWRVFLVNWEGMLQCRH